MDRSGEILGITESEDGMQKGTKQKSTTRVFSPAPKPLLAQSHSVVSLSPIPRALRSGPEHLDVNDRQAYCSKGPLLIPTKSF